MNTRIVVLGLVSFFVISPLQGSWRWICRTSSIFLRSVASSPCSATSSLRDEARVVRVAVVDAYSELLLCGQKPHVFIASNDIRLTIKDRPQDEYAQCVGCGTFNVDHMCGYCLNLEGEEKVSEAAARKEGELKDRRRSSFDPESLTDFFASVGVKGLWSPRARPYGSF